MNSRSRRQIQISNQAVVFYHGFFSALVTKAYRVFPKKISGNQVFDRLKISKFLRRPQLDVFKVPVSDASAYPTFYDILEVWIRLSFERKVSKEFFEMVSR